MLGVPQQQTEPNFLEFVLLVSQVGRLHPQAQARPFAHLGQREIDVVR